jgi:organic radical activating enzyme
MLKVNEIFYSLQGEGSRTGRPTTFIRLSGCNLKCPWCDTDHENYQEMMDEAILKMVLDESMKTRWACLTGGEPFTQEITHLVTMLIDADYRIQIETNGLLLAHSMSSDVLPYVDLLTVSPKLWVADKYGAWEGFPWLINLPKAAEVKLVLDENDPRECIEFFLQGDFPIYLQPESCKKESTERCVRLVKAFADERVRLGVQVHKIVGMR